MSFQAYIDNIQAKTGKGPEQFRKWGADHGFSTNAGLATGIRPGVIVAALKDEFGLGHGHAMAIVALLKGARRVGEDH